MSLTIRIFNDWYETIFKYHQFKSFNIFLLGFNRSNTLWGAWSPMARCPSLSAESRTRKLDFPKRKLTSSLFSPSFATSRESTRMLARNSAKISRRRKSWSADAKKRIKTSSPSRPRNTSPDRRRNTSARIQARADWSERYSDNCLYNRRIETKFFFIKESFLVSEKFLRLTVDCFKRKKKYLHLYFFKVKHCAKPTSQKKIWKLMNDNNVKFQVAQNLILVEL